MQHSITISRTLSTVWKRSASVRKFRPQTQTRFLTDKKTSPSSSPSQNWKNNGTPEIVVGTTILALLGVDYFLQKQQDASREEIMFTLQSVVQQDETKAKEEQELRHERENIDLQKQEGLFDCIVRRSPKYFDGSKCLMGVNVGDRIVVLEECVGPDGMYNLCRLYGDDADNTASNNSVGWFPISCLEKVN